MTRSWLELLEGLRSPGRRVKSPTIPISECQELPWGSQSPRGCWAAGTGHGCGVMSILWRPWKPSLVSFERGWKQKAQVSLHSGVSYLVLPVSSLPSVPREGGLNPESGRGGNCIYCEDSCRRCCCCYYIATITMTFLSVTLCARYYIPSAVISVHFNKTPAKLIWLAVCDTWLGLREVDWFFQHHTAS